MTTRSHHLSFALPDALLSMNGSRGESSYARRLRQQSVATWRTAAFYQTRNAINAKLIPRHLGFSTIAVDLPVRTLAQRRDAHNFYPTVKAIVDGLVLGEMFVDDSTEYLDTKEPSFHARADDPLVHVWIWVQ